MSQFIVKTLVTYFVKCVRPIKTYFSYFLAIIKLFVYFVSARNKLVDVRKAGLIRSDRVILDEKLKH